MRPRAAALIAALGAMLVPGLAACSSSEATGETIVVTSTNAECRVSQASLAAGKHRFQVDNTGSQVTEVYVYAAGDKVVAEKENVGPGTKATFTATVSPGRYDVACKPGQTGNGIRQAITVT